MIELQAKCEELTTHIDLLKNCKAIVAMYVVVLKNKDSYLLFWEY